MLIVRKFKPSQLYNNHYKKVSVKNIELEKPSEIKYLGLIIAESLKKHVNYVMSKMYKKVRFLRRIRNTLNLTH